MILVDTNVILDILDDDTKWANWSIAQLNKLYKLEPLRINAIVYAELSKLFVTTADLDASLSALKLGVEYIPREAAFLAGKAFLQYRKQGGTKNSILADFFIGGHAQATGSPLVTRDTKRYVTYFPAVRLITP